MNAEGDDPRRAGVAPPAVEPEVGGASAGDPSREPGAMRGVAVAASTQRTAADVGSTLYVGGISSLGVGWECCEQIDDGDGDP